MKWNKIVSREYSVQYCDVAMHCIGKRAKIIFPVYMEKQLVLPDNNNEVYFFEDNEENKVIASIVNEYTDNKVKFQKFVTLFYKIGEDYVDFCRKTGENDLTAFSNEELREIYMTYQKKCIDYTAILFVGFLLNRYWTKWGSETLTTKDDKIREALFRPTERSTVLVMQEEAAKIKGDEYKIKSFWKKYEWLPCLDLHKDPWTLQEVKDYVNNIKLGRKFERIDFEEAVEKAGLTEEQVEKFQMIKELGYIKDVRDDFRRKGIYYIQPFFKEVAGRMNISLKEIAYLTEAEIIDFLSGEEVDLSKGKKRQEGFLLYFKDDEVVCVDHAINDELAKIGFVEEKAKVKHVIGTVACKGTATGTAKVVRTVHDILKVKRGDIIIAVTTHPDYVPAMQLAAAIVTDEGGILSHAAIVSRELGIPCIVGTKYATKVFPHGCMVEVDAQKGKVRRVD
jgi:phosphohistidine swiveling domain-containing protein